MNAAHFHRCVEVLTHPRTSAGVEVAYAVHGLHSSTHWITYAVFGAILLVSLAHLIWVHVS